MSLLAWLLLSVTLAWDAVSEPGVTGYELRYGPSPGHYTKSVRVDQSTRTARVSNAEMPLGDTFFVVIALAGTKESLPSNEVRFRRPIAPRAVPFGP